MRLFTGIELDPSVVAASAQLIDELRRRAEQQTPRPRIAWVLPDRLHITVRFIGHSDEAAYARIQATLSPPILMRPFTLRIESLGSFPSRGAPRVIWAGMTGDVESLSVVEQDVTARLANAGVPPEARPYSPHLTLGRVKEANGFEASTLVRGLSNVVLGTTTVEAITLFESRVSSKGPVYVPLLRATLTPTP
jgi:2'-5' RNA ligase